MEIIIHTHTHTIINWFVRFSDQPRLVSSNAYAGAKDKYRDNRITEVQRHRMFTLKTLNGKTTRSHRLQTRSLTVRRIQ